MNKTYLRLIDASFNRSREAVRVMEDYARFILNDTLLSSQAKNLRHDLSQTVAQLPLTNLIDARDILGDVGTTISTKAESTRTDEQAVIRAAASRLSEALRSLEEYTKIDHPDLAARFESLRYRSYDLEKRLLSRVDISNRLSNMHLYVLLTQSLTPIPLMDLVPMLLDAGVDAIQLREKDLPDGQLLELAQKIATLCHDAGSLFFMNDRPDLAVLANADGVHLGQDDLKTDQARHVMKPHMIVGKSTHNLNEVTLSTPEMPDYLAIGAIYPSPTKPSVKTAGVDMISQVRKTYSGPLIAIGGITPENLPPVIQAGATGIALCQAIIAAEDPKKAAQTIKNQLLSLISGEKD